MISNIVNRIKIRIDKEFKTKYKIKWFKTKKIYYKFIKR